MAASSLSAPSIPFPRTTKSFHPFSIRCSFPSKHTFPLNSHRRPSPTVSAAATTSGSIEVDLSTVSATPSKPLPFRVGHGFDLHRLEPGYPLIIGGINIPHDRGCEAHSDGNVLLHCVVDAILEALGLPDIGQIFPDSDP